MNSIGKGDDAHEARKLWQAFINCQVSLEKHSAFLSANEKFCDLFEKWINSVIHRLNMLTIR